MEAFQQLNGLPEIPAPLTCLFPNSQEKHIFSFLFIPWLCKALTFTQKRFLGSQELIAEALINSSELQVLVPSLYLGQKSWNGRLRSCITALQIWTTLPLLNFNLRIRNQIIWLIKTSGTSGLLSFNKPRIHKQNRWWYHLNHIVQHKIYHKI